MILSLVALQSSVSFEKSSSSWGVSRRTTTTTDGYYYYSSSYEWYPSIVASIISSNPYRRNITHSQQQVNVDHDDDDDDDDGCTFYPSIDDIYALPDPDNVPPTCLYSVINPGKNIVHLKVVTSVSYITYYQRGLDSFINYVTDPINDHTLVVYVVGNDTLSTLDRPHFGKIAGMQHTLKTQKQTLRWLVFTDMDFLVRRNPDEQKTEQSHHNDDDSKKVNSTSQQTTIPTLSDAISSAPPTASLIIQREPIRSLCSAFHIWRPTNWTDKFLQDWIGLGRSGCCKVRLSFYDQIAWFALLGDYKAAGIPIKAKLHQRLSDLVIDHEQSQRDYYLTDVPLHGSYWNGRTPEETLFWHTGHGRWRSVGKLAQLQKDLPFY
mmetsp:Transcript_30361/g.73844  ORF Transcript_30361/g.73844 Transcript_30361/m.73844 type:complete len:378 (-) Transcript_30361:273-1406(-)